MQTVTAYPLVSDVPAANRFLNHVFGATERVRMIGSARGYHTEVEFGDTQLMVGGGGAGVEWKGETRPMAFHIYVPDKDATYQRALDQGAETGEGSDCVRDPWGNRWHIATVQGAPALHPVLQPVHAQPLIDFLVAAFGAVEAGHRSLKIGNSALELIERAGIYQPMPGMFYLRVADTDQTYNRAVECGAVSQSAPQDQPYGDRNGSIQDPAGNIWYIAAPMASR